MLPAVSVKGRVIYDDDCGICRAFRKSAEKNADPADFEFIPRRDADPDDYLPYPQSIGALDAVIFIDSHGRSYKGAAAISQILRQIKRPWSMLGKFISIPVVRNIAEYVYRFCARQRQRVSKALNIK
jgi:predicted DCC family thiol-disulfide oxidoreductase YuxK